MKIIEKERVIKWFCEQITNQAFCEEKKQSSITHKDDTWFYIDVDPEDMLDYCLSHVIP